MMFSKSLLDMILEWTNGRIRLQQNGIAQLHRSEMLQYLAFLLVSHTTGLSFEKTIDALKVFGTVLPTLERVRWMLANILAFPIVGRGNEKFLYLDDSALSDFRPYEI